MGLVKHTAFLKQVWFDVALGGRTRAEIGLPTAVDCRFILNGDDNVESVLVKHRRAWTNADEIAEAHSLDDVDVYNHRGPMSLRWIYVHMIYVP